MVVIACKCQKINEANATTTTILLQNLGRFIKWKPIFDKHMILMQQTEARAPRLTAAEFFMIDYTMLFTFINILINYIIVIVQFSLTIKQ